MPYDRCTFTATIHWDPAEGFSQVGLTLHGLDGPFADPVRLTMTVMPHRPGQSLSTVLDSLHQLVVDQVELYDQRWGVQETMF